MARLSLALAMPEVQDSLYDLTLESRRRRIALASAFQGLCAGGFAFLFWDDVGPKAFLFMAVVTNLVAVLPFLAAASLLGGHGKPRRWGFFVLVISAALVWIVPVLTVPSLLCFWALDLSGVEAFAAGAVGLFLLLGASAVFIPVVGLARRGLTAWSQHESVGPTIGLVLVVRPGIVAKKCVGREVGAEHGDGLGEHVGEESADG